MKLGLLSQSLEWQLSCSGCWYLLLASWASRRPKEPGRTSWWFGLFGFQNTGPAVVPLEFLWKGRMLGVDSVVERADVE